MSRYDLVILNGTAVLPGLGPQRMDIGVKGGRIAAIGDGLSGGDGAAVIACPIMHHDRHFAKIPDSRFCAAECIHHVVGTGAVRRSLPKRSKLGQT